MNNIVMRCVLLLSLLVLVFAGGTTMAQQQGAIEFGLELVAEGFTAPVDLQQPDDDSGRLFVVDQIGIIHIVSAEGELLGDPFLNLQDRMVELDQGYDERGLLGLAFHPDYANNGRFFVYYSAPLSEDAPSDWNHTSHVSEFTVMADDENRADPESERVIFTVDQPQSNHNAGDLVFGPDGYLYIPLGDGGGADDTGPGHTESTGNAQDTSNLLGSILRIDVDNGDPYSIPDDNPYVNDDAVPDEIWAWGFRNPWGVSFDSGGSNQLFVADAGQNVWEEVSIVEGGNNYGWNIREGSHCFSPENPNHNPLNCATEGADGSTLQPPVIEYSHQVGLVVVGGFVYRGSSLPAGAFEGSYIFGDWSTDFGQPYGKIFAAAPPPEGTEAMWNISKVNLTSTEDGELGEFLLAFGQDASNELYALTSTTPGPVGETGRVWRLVASEG